MIRKSTNPGHYTPQFLMADVSCTELSRKLLPLMHSFGKHCMTRTAHAKNGTSGSQSIAFRQSSSYFPPSAHKVAKAKLRPKRPKPWGWANCWWTRSGTTDACPAHNYPTPLTLKNHATLHTLFHALDVILCAPNFSRPLQKRCK